MPKKCYCGNENLLKYSEAYHLCDKCHVLVSRKDMETEECEVSDEDHDLYGSNYWKKIMTDVVGETSLEGVIDYYIKDRVAYWIQYILRYIPIGSKVAEIGCGLGQLAYLMKTIGYQQTAYELSPEICEYIRINLGVNMHCGEFGETEEKFDAILAFDLLEHISDPKGFLKRIFDSLTEDGILCIQMPNFDYTLTFQEMREKKPRFEVQLKEKEHLFLYSKESIIDLLRQIGFSNVNFEPACFGEDFDMFLFAGKKELTPVSEEQALKALDNVNGGKIVKALCQLYTEKKNLENKLHVIEQDALVRLENNHKLENILKKSEADRAARYQIIQTLESTLKKSEEDRAARLQVIQKCNQQISIQDEVIQENNLLLTQQRDMIEKGKAEICELEDANQMLAEQNESLRKMVNIYQEKAGIKRWSRRGKL